MSYNLRQQIEQRILLERLVHTQFEEEIFGGEPSESEEDNVSEFEDTEEEDEELEEDLENVSLKKRMRLSLRNELKEENEELEEDLENVSLNKRMRLSLRNELKEENEELEEDLENVSLNKRMRLSLRNELEEELDNASLSQRIQERSVRGRPKSKLREKNGYVWSKNEPARQSDRLIPVLPEYIPGPIRDAANLNTIHEFWNILFNDEMINIIVESTNEQIENHCAVGKAQDRESQSYHHRHTDANEIKAYIAILYHSGLWKSNRVDAKRLWSHENGISFYRCVMPYKRFMFLSVCLRFDIKTTRSVEDRFAPVRKLWEIFIGNCQKNYNPSSTCTVGQQLHGFRGRCKHRVYMKSKPDKYGLMFKTLNDAATAFLIYAIPYLGKSHGATSGEPVPEFFFREVTTPIHGTNRTVTVDNWFTTIPLVERMLEEPYNLTITGTIRKNKREIPAEMKVASKKIPDSKFRFTDKITLVTHTPKKNKIDLLVSSFITSSEITDGKPNIVFHYNKTKGGADTFDQLCHSFSTARRTRRWPLRVFFGILDQAIVNARILLTCRLVNAETPTKITAQKCMEGVIEHLSKPSLQERYTILTLRKDIRYALAGILGLDKAAETSNESQVLMADNYARCAICPAKKDKKTKARCAACNRPMCNDHRSGFCTDCGCFE